MAYLRTFTFLSLIATMFLSTSYVQAQDQKPTFAIPLISQLVKKSNDGQWNGPLIDMARQIEEKTGLEFDIQVVPFKRAVAMTKSGRSDFGIFMESAQRNQIALPVIKLGDASFVVVSLKDTPIHTLSDLRGRKVARIRGGAAIKSLAAIDDIEYHQFSTHDDGVKLLTAKRVDALITADFRILDAFENTQLSPDQIAKPVWIEDREIWLYWSWNSNLDFSHIRKLKQGIAIKTFNEKGDLNQLEERLKQR